MDFVVLGFGMGALAVLIGLGVRDLGPLARRLPGPDRDDLPWSEVARRVAWGRTCRAAGLLVTLAGAGLCLVTLVALIGGASDGVGMLLVGLACLLVALSLAVWMARDRQLGDRRTEQLARRPRQRPDNLPHRPLGSKRRATEPSARSAVTEQESTERSRPRRRSGAISVQAGTEPPGSARAEPDLPNPTDPPADPLGSSESPRIEGQDPAAVARAERGR